MKKQKTLTLTPIEPKRLVLGLKIRLDMFTKARIRDFREFQASLIQKGGYDEFNFLSDALQNLRYYGGDFP